MAVARAVDDDASNVGSRRRELGSGSDRSLLLTVLGEFVHPGAAPVWTATLVAGLAALGVEERSARYPRHLLITRATRTRPIRTAPHDNRT